MFTPTYQMYKIEHGLHVSAAEQRAADVRAGEVAAALGELRHGLGRALRLGRYTRPRRAAAAAMTAPVRFVSSAR